MNKIIVADILGVHCGMHYYDETFVSLLKDSGFEVKLLSNFSINSDQNIFFDLIFKKNKFYSIILLTKSVIKFFIYILRNRDKTVIYLSYGEIYDLLFILAGLSAKKLYIDVHEVYALKYKDNSFVANFITLFYSCFVSNIIFHSKRTASILHNKVSNMIYVPHFKYTFKKKYNKHLISDDIKNVFLNGSTKKFLFFGNLSYAKGIDIVENIFISLSEEQLAKTELVIAGKNVEKIDFSLLKTNFTNINVFDRHITDDELVYLYTHTDYVLLPYRRSSQSGILAMATYFRKPMILTNISYFENEINKFPSFGILSSLDNFRKCVIDIIEDKIIKEFYTVNDCNKDDRIEDYQALIKELYNN